MLDVHVPQKSEHTWTDFTLHIATICVGLLIAIGLEQGVEWLHHRHELHRLREDLREEDEKALRDNADLVQSSGAVLAYYSQRIALVQDAIRNHKPVTHVPLPQFPTTHSAPDDPVWRAAKASNLIEVMPQQDIKAYSEIDSVLDSWRMVNKDLTAGTALFTFERQFSAPPKSPGIDLFPVLDFSSASQADLVEELRLLSAVQLQLFEQNVYNLQIDGALRAVLSGERDLDRIDDAENKAVLKALSMAR